MGPTTRSLLRKQKMNPLGKANNTLSIDQILPPPVVGARVTSEMQPVTRCSRRKRKHSELSPQANEDDPFVHLPDDIITSHILSRLPLKEAVSTSVLSHRWEKLWTRSLGPNLVFSYLQDPYEDLEWICKEGARILGLQLARGISRILATYNKPTLDELAVRFNFDSSSSIAIDSWVEHAFRKGVAQLDLDFSPWTTELLNRYTFPGVEKLSTLHACCDNHLHQPVNCAGMSNLRVVSLKFVNVSSEVINFMLSNCPLERLCVWESMLSKKIKVSGRSSRLKSLEFVRCGKTKIDVSSENLVSLRYSGYAGSLRLEHVPRLTELSIGDDYCRTFLSEGGRNFSYISQLKRLTLELDHMHTSESIRYSLEFPKLVKLEQLEVKFTLAYGDSCLLWPVVLIKAAPHLRKFSVKLHTSATITERTKTPRKGELKQRLREAARLINHQCLKLIEMRGFTGCPNELELGHCLLGVSPSSLEKFVIARERPRPERVLTRWRIDDSWSWCRDEYLKLAKCLVYFVPAGAKFFVR